MATANKTAVAILPARGGSKRIPHKNIKPFLGHPAIHWPIRAAHDSGVFARIIVSTNDDAIAATARAAGAEVPFRRDAGLADDHTGTTEVIRDAVLRLELPPETPVCCLYPTAVLIRPQDLAAGLDRLDRAAWVLSLGAYRTPIDRAYGMDAATGRVMARDIAMMPKRSQDLNPAYYDLGAFYWALAATWMDPAARVWLGAAAVVLPPERCIDIDTEDDWVLAERMAAALPAMAP